MPNILLLTNIYPIDKFKLYSSTSVCHYFAKEWVKNGHHVKVVYNYSIYNSILHWISKYLYKSISGFFATVINSYRFKEPYDYEYEGVNVHLIPCYKFIPKIPFPKKSLYKTIKTIVSKLNKDSFCPDLIVGHFLNPNIELLPKLKEVYGCPIVLILHGQIKSGDDIAIIRNNFKSIDCWGFRSIPIKRSFEDKGFKPTNKFLCFSGVPEKYIENNIVFKHSDFGVYKFVYVGNLINRKYPCEVAEALINSNINFDLSYIGTGRKETNLRRIKARLRGGSQINLLGRRSREDVADLLKDSECFIMISKDETFGLVYLEAMAKGCIVIASKNEGMDGIIINGENGFLCEAGNTKELESILKHIQTMTPAQKKLMAEKAIQTASNLTDKRVGQEYLSNILKLIDLENKNEE